MAPGADFGTVGAVASVMAVVIPLVFVALVVAGIVGVIRSYGANKRRRAALEATVAAHHLGHVDEDPARAEIFTSPPFGIGRSRRARDVVWGMWAGRPFETFAYSYETETTDAEGRRTTTTHRFQVTWVPLPRPVPTVRITSDSALLRVFARMGARDLTVESHEFNQRWKVWSEDERAAHAILGPRTIERLLAPDVQGRAFVYEGAAVFSYAPVVTDLAELPLVVGALYDLVDLMPGFLTRQSSDDAPGGA